MADALLNPAATLALGAEESITILVYGRWVVTTLEDRDVKEVKMISVFEVDEKTGTNCSLITWNTKCCQVNRVTK